MKEFTLLAVLRGGERREITALSKNYESAMVHGYAVLTIQQREDCEYIEVLRVRELPNEDFHGHYNYE